ncbi:hypothetical protein BZK31_04615 [Pseudomonas floridensis]|uniref:Uncharacterized protein n=1 Tax=Pseudomonas floridensis TaxID=1958950 RepID=A0A1X0NAC5_9PSED|nr:hypothetical protein [Pseudomonas floridensis]ORC61038.1 hypothetical protein BZK31_04615 [Pseudomonas floridensis]
MITNKLTALTLAGLMAVASGAAFAETVNNNATKLPGTNTLPADRNSSSTVDTQGVKAQNQAQQPKGKSATHDKNAHGGTHTNGDVTEKPKTN